MKYYPIVKKWYKIKKHLNNKELNNILIKDFNKYTYGRWKQKFKKGMFPRDFESCDWDWSKRGRKPEFYKFVKHAACHWLVNFNLKLATLVEPNKNWRILTSDEHSTVWDGGDILFDMNFFALEINADETFKIANKYTLNINQFMSVNFTEYYSVDLNKNKKIKI